MGNRELGHKSVDIRQWPLAVHWKFTLSRRFKSGFNQRRSGVVFEGHEKFGFSLIGISGLTNAITSSTKMPGSRCSGRGRCQHSSFFNG